MIQRFFSSSRSPVAALRAPALAAAALAAAALLVPAATADTAANWKFDASVNVWAAGLSGNATVKGIPADVDVGFDDILSNLDGVLAGKLKASNGPWSVGCEFSYLKLGAAKPPVTVDMTQWLVEPTVGYRLSDVVEGFVGARYNSIDVTATFQGPSGTVKSGRQTWWDPIIGAEVKVPLSDPKYTLAGRFDVGGTNGLTWQVFPYLDWKFSDTMSAQAGYRWLGTNYESGSGTSKFRYDVVTQGPQLNLVIRF
jgi:hypothetical protein